MTRRNNFSCINFILLVPFFWLPLYVYLHFVGRMNPGSAVRHFDSKISEHGFDTNRNQERRTGVGHERDGNYDMLQRHIPEIHAQNMAHLESNREHHGAGVSESKWRQRKLPKSASLHGNRGSVVKLTVRRKPGRNLSAGNISDSSRSIRQFKRTFESTHNDNLLKVNISAALHVEDRPGSDIKNKHSSFQGNSKLPFQNAGYRWTTDGPGEMGKPVHLSPEEQERADATFDINKFNLVISDRVALNRTLPDVRPPRCRMLRYPQYLPRTSVIIVFHNEAWSTLLRTITSVVNRSPHSLLHEIILVDDSSDPQCDWLRKPLESYVADLPVPVRVERLNTRQGIVAARHVGVAASSGEVLTFLDSHCECTEGWLEPLLDRISKDRTRVLSPVIDSISDTTFEYSAVHGLAFIGGFSWLPEFLWMETPLHEQRRVNYDINTPLRTPTMAGGLFSIHREFFHRLGGYDTGLTIWGGDNLQLSFKVWQCGGSIEILPCSHVGHIFRSATPYSFPLGAETTILRNNRRILEVWTDAYTRELFYAMTPAYRTVDYGDVTGELSLRDGLNCKSFQWYLNHIYPEHTLPMKFKALGAIKNIGVNMCLDVIASRKDGKRDEETDAALELCHGSGPGQVFAYNMKNQLQHDRHCLTAEDGSATPLLSFCVDEEAMNENQRWIYNTGERSIVNVATRKCLDVQPTENKHSLFLATTNDCDGALSQQWTMHNITINGFS